MGTIFTAQKENVAPVSTPVTSKTDTNESKDAKKEQKSSKDSTKANLKKKMKASTEVVRKSKRPKKPSRLIRQETYIMDNVVKKSNQSSFNSKEVK